MTSGPAQQRWPERLNRLRAELAHLRARYDDGAVSPAIFKVIRKIETEIAWLNHTAKEENENAAA
jgi:hypothetical protein